jgi:adenosine deaminase
VEKRYGGVWMAWGKCSRIIAFGLSFVIVVGWSPASCLHDQARIDHACIFARLMPKVNLHVHLEGSIQPATLFMLARRNGVQLPVHNVSEWRNFLHFKNFNDFAHVYDLVERCLRTKQDYALIAYEFGKACAQQNIRYAEVTFTLKTPQSQSPIPWKKVLAGLNEGRHKAERDFGVTWGWIFDMVIGDNVKDAEVVYNFIRKNRHKGIVAVGLSCTRKDNVPVGRYAYIFDRARKDGIPRALHAGEHKGGRSVDMRDAIYVLHANRIGHGVMCAHDPGLRAILRQRHIPLEICVTSNVRIGVFPNYAAHPVRQLWDDGLFITIGSDDPGVFGTDLVNEYQLLVKQYHFTASELEQVSLNGIKASFLSEREKVRLEGEFKADFTKLRMPIVKQQAVRHSSTQAQSSNNL